MTFEKPKKPVKPLPLSPAIAKPDISKRKKVINSGGNHSGSAGRPPGSGGGNGGGQPPTPSPWLDADNEPRPDPSASFVEYLRWMRSPDAEYKDPSKVQLLQMAQEGANYSTRLQQLTQRTQLIAQNTFKVQCPWRIRVGGHRGPESILLPAFDALGMPYIPSSTLRGLARTQAIREIMTQQQISWKQAEKEVAPWFGSLESNNKSDGLYPSGSDRAGKIIFLDAYPLPNQKSDQKVLAVDMANNIWKWDSNSLEYSPNPNPFLSLEKPIFVIGLRLVSGCQDTQILEKVRQWLIDGLQAGAGSQVNTGYGQLIPAGKVTHKNEFYRIEFILQGQLIHGQQKFKNVLQPYQKDYQGGFRFDKQGKLRSDTTSSAEVRPVAFKSMLRYWFRAIGLGVLSATKVQEWEGKIFGTITPQKEHGWLMVRILEGKNTQREPQGKNDDCGEQQGILTLSFSSAVPQSQQNALKELSQNLIWLMFHLGGIGQGARRPCYSRQSRQYAPWWRGSTLIPQSDESFWFLPETAKEFHQVFQKRLQSFYTALQALDPSCNYRSLKTCGAVSRDKWTEAIDTNCRIVVCSGKADFGKPYALAVLHSEHFKTNGNYDGNLCGKVGREVKPSPVWIADLDDYQVVTVFGASADPRKAYLETLRNSIQLFPL
ncbi:type III-B CRISPR module RAMP protein Cmr6 [Nostoc sp. 'Peltigera membranacea cyanobiont' N6]|uniref:type III-B CRISPR module RAMP protein Cmr6 n=1 Tax=Nostoc sp. 'Peltigera membranacea cyanobiont' N6 TaxID=1261031 RepID=UPI000CF35C39|nr:type III-B CRISPR module RAMP protein Cmr6 [Nostoc sp. 'Peltigera membranacea cyanobiont' N6]AVH66344.1 CRISPR-associated protein Cmr6 [Nostoc sp. 'Peltigera membranacea cyanobiont' N6]